MSNTASEIKDGIEWYEFKRHDGTIEREAACARCGSSAYFEDCDNCGGEGHYEASGWGADDFEQDDEVTCDSCQGRGGFWHCLSSRVWCDAHPLIGRDHIASTAFESSGVDP